MVSLDPATIKIDAARFQFKSGGDAQGVTNALAGVKEWDDNASGVALVWEDAKGDRYIVDGHQRLALAQRLKAQGQTPRSARSSCARPTASPPTRRCTSAR